MENKKKKHTKKKKKKWKMTTKPTQLKMII